MKKLYLFLALLLPFLMITCSNDQVDMEGNSGDSAEVIDEDDGKPHPDGSFDYSKIAPHPRLMLSKDQETILKENLEKNPDMRIVHNEIIKVCDNYLRVEPVKYELEGKRLLNVSREALMRILYLSYAYRTTGDNRYCLRAEREVNAVCDFKDWDPNHFLDAAEMAKWNANGSNFKVGMVKPVDQNGDYKLDANDDKVILGNKTPRWTLGWTNTFTWKGVELGIELYGRFGYMISTGGEAQAGMFQQREIDYWTPSNPNAEWQMPIYGSGDSYASLLGYKDASFLKLRNISLGYNIPDNICHKLGIGSLKVYMQARNLGDIYSSIDYIDLDLGTSYYNRGVTFGLNIGF